MGAVDLAAVLEGGCVSNPPALLTRTDGRQLLYQGKLHLLYGEPESGKSWAALIAVAEVLGAGGHALYIDFEDNAEGIVGRLVALGVKPEVIVERLTYIQPSLPFTLDAEALLRSRFETLGPPAIAVIDGLTEAMALANLNPNEGTDVSRYYAGLPRALTRTGAPTAILDHVVKNGRDRGRWAIGSVHKLAGIDGAGLPPSTRSHRSGRDAPGGSGSPRPRTGPAMSARSKPPAPGSWPSWSWCRGPTAGSPGRCNPPRRPRSPPC